MIPKTIHYCWFGDLPEPQEISEWKKILSDYTFMKWNERNFDIETSCDYVREAYQAKKWAFVSDYVRIHALYYYGGIYLDTDVKIIKPFDDDVLINTSFISMESENTLCTAVIGATKGALWLNEILKLYEIKHFKINNKYDEYVNSRLLFDYFNQKVKLNYEKNEIIQIPNEIMIYPMEYFCAKNIYTYQSFITSNTYTIHCLDATWYNKKRKCLRFLKRIFLEIFGVKSYKYINEKVFKRKN